MGSPSAAQTIEEMMLLDGPGARPPNGQTSDFDSPEDVSVYAIPVIVTSLCLTTLAVGMRIYTRRFILRFVSWDDCKPCDLVVEVLVT